MKSRVFAAVLLCAMDGAARAQSAAIVEAEQTSVSDWQAFWNEQSASGAVRGDYYRSSHSLDNTNGFFGATAQIKAVPKFGDRVDGKLEARVTNSDLPGDAKTHSSLLEAYLALHFERSDLRVGKQIVAWGRADGINPTDNLTPHDYVVLLPFEEDQRFGTSAVKWDNYLSNELTFTIFATPFFEPAKIPSLAQGGASVETRPAHTLADGEVALKLNRTGGDLDWSVSYLRGHNLLPSARLLGADATWPQLELHYDRINVLGADVAHNFGRYGFRAEAAYFSTQDKNGGDPSVMNPYFYYVAGFDRTFSESLNLNLQVFGRWVRNFNDPQSIPDALQRELALQNAITDGQQARVSYGWTARLGNKWLNDTLEAELLVVANITQHNAFLRPLISYAVTDRMKATAGGEIYQGARSSYFGRLKPNQGMFSELKYSF